MSETERLRLIPPSAIGHFREAMDERNDFKNRARAAESLAATARRDAFEEAAKVADREEAECRDSANGTEGERSYWTPCANTARLIAKDIRSLASTVPWAKPDA